MSADRSAPDLQFLTTDVLEIACERHGTPGGWPVILLHGFPYDVRSYDEVALRLAAAGAEVVVPYLRGYGPTRFLATETPRSGQQAALAADVRDMIDGLGLDAPILAGFDWGGRAACVAAMLWPERVGGLVTIGGYNVHDVTRMATVPELPAVEAMNWYQWYFHSERGRSGLTTFRREIAAHLWRTWSPSWDFSEETFDATARSFETPDFVEVVIHSYRVRYAMTAGDPAYDALEARVAPQPPITVPTIVIDPTIDPIMPPTPLAEHAAHFTDLVDYRQIAAGHNTPQEAPAHVASAILDLHTRSLDGSM